MDPTTLATKAVSLLVPYLAKAGEAIAQKAGQAIWDSLKARFASDKDAATALKQLSSTPHSGGRRIALKEVVEEQIQADREFAETLLQLVAEVKQPSGDISQTISISHGNAGDLTQIAKTGDS